MNQPISLTSLNMISRRRFVQGIASAGTLAALSGNPRHALAETAAQMPTELSGSHFGLTLDTLPVNFTGRKASPQA